MATYEQNSSANGPRIQKYHSQGSARTTINISISIRADEDTLKQMNYIADFLCLQFADFLKKKKYFLFCKCRRSICKYFCCLFNR